MLETETLFIVGAGASREYGLPTGVELIPKIASALTMGVSSFNRIEGDPAIVQALDAFFRREESSYQSNANNLIHASSTIRRGLIQAISIDNYLDAHQSNNAINILGKLGIARCILSAEDKSTIQVKEQNSQDTINFGKNSDKWLFELFKILSEGVPVERCHHIFNKATFISFNYDRCIEHYFMHAIMNYYNIDAAKSAKIINEGLYVFHPYGKVGSLSWQGSRRPTNFGAGDRLSGDDLLAVAEQIKTFTEQVDEGDDLTAMREAVAQAEKIVALGFAFHPQNLALIEPNRRSAAQRVFATALGASNSDRDVLAADIRKWLKGDRHTQINADNLTCAGLFNEYRRSIPRG